MTVIPVRESLLRLHLAPTYASMGPLLRPRDIMALTLSVIMNLEQEVLEVFMELLTTRV